MVEVVEMDEVAIMLIRKAVQGESNKTIAQGIIEALNPFAVDSLERSLHEANEVRLSIAQDDERRKRERK